MNRIVKKIANKVFSPESKIRHRPSSTRKFLLEMMPKNSICVEVGVWEGNFSEQILKTVKPKKLILIDSWVKENPIQEKRYQKVLDKFQNEIKNYRRLQEIL